MDNPEDNYEYDDQEKPGEEQPGKDPQNEGSDEDPAERFRRLTSRASLPPELPEDGTIGIYRGSPPAENSDEEVEEKPQSEEVPDEEISPNPSIPLCGQNLMIPVRTAFPRGWMPPARWRHLIRMQSRRIIWCLRGFRKSPVYAIHLQLKRRQDRGCHWSSCLTR